MRFTLIATAMSAALLILACNNTDAPKEQTASVKTEALDSTQLIKRGLYLTTIGGCNDCHTPKVMGPQGPALDTANLLSGFASSRPFTFDKKMAFTGGVAIMHMENTAYAGPWGVSYAANLTPDETGTGNWTFAQFKKAMTEGKYKGLDNARPLMPPMPWENYRNMPEEDLAAIFAYLRSIKAVKNAVPGIEPPVL